MIKDNIYKMKVISEKIKKFTSDALSFVLQTGVPTHAAAHFRRNNPNHHHQEAYCAKYGGGGGLISIILWPTIHNRPTKPLKTEG